MTSHDLAISHKENLYSDILIISRESENIRVVEFVRDELWSGIELFYGIRKIAVICSKLIFATFRVLIHFCTKLYKQVIFLTFQKKSNIGHGARIFFACRLLRARAEAAVNVIEKAKALRFIRDLDLTLAQ